MHQTPGLPGTSPVTDNPNPRGSQGMDPLGPSTGGEPGGDAGAERSAAEAGTGGPNPTDTRPGREGGGNVRAGSERTFRCSDVGNADCRWEVTGRTEDELLPKIEQHARDAHGVRDFGAEAKNKLRNAIRERRAA